MPDDRSSNRGPECRNHTMVRCDDLARYRDRFVGGGESIGFATHKIAGPGLGTILKQVVENVSPHGPAALQPTLVVELEMNSSVDATATGFFSGLGKTGKFAAAKALLGRIAERNVVSSEKQR